jgi:hypothetical protein
MTAEEPPPTEVTETIAAWAAGVVPPDRDWSAINFLVSMIDDDPELWWRAIRDAIPTLDSENRKRFSMGPVAALLLAGGSDWANRLAVDARDDRRIASLLADSLSFLGRASAAWRDGPSAYDLLGREFVARTWIRHQSAIDIEQLLHSDEAGPLKDVARMLTQSSDRDWDFWAWEAVNDLAMRQDAEVREVILRLVELATSESGLGNIGAGPLEDILPGSLGWAEEQAALDPRFAIAFATARHH